MKLNNKKTLTIILPLIAVIGIFLFGHSALAAWDWVISIVAGFLGVFIWMLGVILVIVIKGLILIASYQNFIGSPAVTLGWVIVRDICNMFFVVVLLIIAFGTILHLEEYSYKKWLPKLILMAVLINFSKTICGLMIDAAQIVMLTFVNAFKDVGGANLTDILGLSDIVTLAKTEGAGATLWTVVGAYGLGFIYLLIAIVTIVTMMMMLVMRLVMIWLYVVLSPLAYLLSAFPGGQKYASQWWDEFVKNLIVGPVLAFFIWLSFAALQTYNQSNFDSEVTKTNESAKADISNLGDIGNATAPDAVAASKASTPGFLIQYVIAIGMLLGGLKISQEIGGAAGSMAGKGMAAIQKGQGIAMGAGKGLAKWGGRQLGDLRDIASKKLNIDLNVVAAEKRRREQVEHNRAIRQTEIRKNTLTQAEKGKTWIGRKLALASTGDIAWQNVIDKKFRVLTAGSPTKAAGLLEKINSGQAEKGEIEKNISGLKGESSRIITNDDRRKSAKRVAELTDANVRFKQQKQDIISNPIYKSFEEKERNHESISEAEQKVFDKERSRAEGLDANIKINEAEIKDLSRAVITIDKLEDNRNRIKVLKTTGEDLIEQRENITEDENYKALGQSESDGSINPMDQRKLAVKRSQLKRIDDKIKLNNEEKEQLSNTHILVADDTAKKQAELARNAEIATEQSKIQKLNKALEGFTSALSKNKLSEVQSARAEINAKMEGEASKKIANFSNSDQLVGIYKEAEKQHDEALMAVAYKKLAKTGNYNELNKELGMGTGYEGMIGMAKRMQDHGGMNEQDARALVAEIGELAKSVNHFEAFGVMTMDKAGSWQEAGKNAQEAAVLSEKSKIQVQQFVRTANRLGTGSYRNDQPHDAEHWDLSRSTIALFASKDKAYSEDLAKTGNINTIQFIGKNEENLKALERAGATKVAALIREICAKAKNVDVSSPLETIRNIIT